MIDPRNNINDDIPSKEDVAVMRKRIDAVEPLANVLSNFKFSVQYKHEGKWLEDNRRVRESNAVDDAREIHKNFKYEVRVINRETREKLFSLAASSNKLSST